MITLLENLNKKQILRTLEQYGLELRACPTGQEQFQRIDPETGLSYTVEYNPRRIEFVPVDEDWASWESAKDILPKLSKEGILNMYKGDSITINGEPRVF